METSGYIQVIKMTDEEKFEMYMKVPHEELVKMKIESERIMELQDKHIEKLTNILYSRALLPPPKPGQKFEDWQDENWKNLSPEKKERKISDYLKYKVSAFAEEAQEASAIEFILGSHNIDIYINNHLNIGKDESKY